MVGVNYKILANILRIHFPQVWASNERPLARLKKKDWKGPKLECSRPTCAWFAAVFSFSCLHSCPSNARDVPPSRGDADISGTCPFPSNHPSTAAYLDTLMGIRGVLAILWQLRSNSYRCWRDSHWTGVCPALHVELTFAEHACEGSKRDTAVKKMKRTPLHREQTERFLRRIKRTPQMTGLAGHDSRGVYGYTRITRVRTPP